MTSRTKLVALAVLAFNAGCLMTSTPEFNSEQHTAPFLVEATASPSPTLIRLIDFASDPTNEFFSADVVSQDDPTGTYSKVQSRLFIDLDTGAPGSQPYFDEPIPGADLTEPGTLTQASPRVVSVNWNISSVAVPALGCHTATLVAAHTYYDGVSACPCPGDYSQITWQLLICNSSTNQGSCDDIAACAKPFEATPTNNCALYLDAMRDAGTSGCPSVGAGSP